MSDGAYKVPIDGPDPEDEESGERAEKEKAESSENRDRLCILVDAGCVVRGERE